MKNKLEIKRLIRWTRKPEVVVLVAGSLVAGWYLVNNLQDADPGLRAGIIGALGAVVAAIVTHVNTKRREINERHFSEKREAYGKIIELIFDLIMKTKSGKQISGKEAHLVKKMSDIKQGLMVWGSPGAIREWNSFEIQSDSGTRDVSAVIAGMERILREVRKDLGHDDRDLEFGQLFGLVILAEDKRELLGGL